RERGVPRRRVLRVLRHWRGAVQRCRARELEARAIVSCGPRGGVTRIEITEPHTPTSRPIAPHKENTGARIVTGLVIRAIGTPAPPGHAGRDEQVLEQVLVEQGGPEPVHFAISAQRRGLRGLVTPGREGVG